MEFNIRSIPDVKFRTTYSSPVELLALSAQLNFDEYKPTLSLFKYSLEHLECNINNVWLPVKVKDKDVYMPATLETNLAALNELCEWFFNNVLVAGFPVSAE